MRKREQWNMARSKDQKTLDSRKFDWRQREKDWKLRRFQLSTSDLVGVRKNERVRDIWMAVKSGVVARCHNVCSITTRRPSITYAYSY
jgi:hypothetical protein